MAERAALRLAWALRLARLEQPLIAALRRALGRLLDAAFKLVKQWDAPDLTALPGVLAAAWETDAVDIGDDLDQLWRRHAARTVTELVPDLPAPVELDMYEQGAQYAEQARNRIRSIPDTVYQVIAERVANAVRTGATPQELRDEVSRILRPGPDRNREWDWRAARIARTEVHAAISAAQNTAHRAAEQALGVTMWRTWLATDDNRTRPTHEEADGQRRGLSEPFDVGGAKLAFPGDPTGPPQEVINCVVGSTRVDWVGEPPLAATRRSYRGALVKLRTADGNDLTITPNHPVLTPTGYRKAGTLRPGDRVLAAGFAPPPYVDDRPPRIDQIHRAAGKGGSSQRVEGSRVQFHGDGTDQQVDVVRPDRGLRESWHAQTFRKIDQLCFGGLRDREPDLSAAGRASRPPGDQVGRDQPTVTAGAHAVRPGGLVGGGGESPPSHGTQPSQPEAVSFAARSPRDSEAIESAGNHPSVDADFPRHLQDALALGMAPREIVSVEFDSGPAHVYNLETSSGWYIGNGIGLHNCRCVELPVTETGEDMTGPITVEAIAADAADEARQGAMVALIPTQDDAERLAVAGGLPVEELHLTLAFLGDGASWPDGARDALREALGVHPQEPVVGMVFGHAAFNPTGDEPCAVYLVGDDTGYLRRFREWAEHTAFDVAGLMLPEQHDPFFAHVTAGYGLDVEQLGYTGPVVFDRLRVVFAGEAVDYRLESPQEPAPEPVTADADPDDCGCDERPPTPLIEQHRDALVAAMPPQLQRSYVAGEVAARIRWGTPGDFGRCVRQARRHGMGVKAEGACAKLHKLATGKWPAEGKGSMAAAADSAEKRDRAEDAGHAMKGGRYPIENRTDLENAIRAVGRAGGPSGTDTDRAEVRRHIMRQAKRLNLSNLIPDSWSSDGSLTASADPLVELIARIPSCPPPEWFTRRDFDGPTPMTVTADGQIFGHLAEWDTCHAGIRSSCVRPPRSAAEYAEFLLGKTMTADGSQVVTGKITCTGGHADLSLDASGARRHYDDATTHVASVTVWDDPHGIALAGSLLPSITPDQLRWLLASPLSGDWRAVDGNLELVAALAVNTPGYPVRRTLAASADGETTALVSPAGEWDAPGRVTVDDVADAVEARLAERAERTRLVAGLDTAARSSLLRDLGRYPGRNT